MIPSDLFRIFWGSRRGNCIYLLLIRDRQIPASGKHKTQVSDGDLAIPFEQNRPTGFKCNCPRARGGVVTRRPSSRLVQVEVAQREMIAHRAIGAGDGQALARGDVVEANDEFVTAGR